jgi:hypothetical protein
MSDIKFEKTTRASARPMLPAILARADEVIE